MVKRITNLVANAQRHTHLRRQADVQWRLNSFFSAVGAHSVENCCNFETQYSFAGRDEVHLSHGMVGLLNSERAFNMFIHFQFPLTPFGRSKYNLIMCETHLTRILLNTDDSCAILFYFLLVFNIAGMSHAATSFQLSVTLLRTNSNVM